MKFENVDRRIVIGGISAAAASALIAALVARRRNKPLGLARIRSKSKIKCPLLAVEDKATRRTQFWEHAMLDPIQCKVRGLDIDHLPAHIEPFGEFMITQSKKIMAPRDIVKAYLLTVSSVQRGAITTKKVRGAWPGLRSREKRVRPEDVMGAILETPAGQRYLDAAARGKYDTRDARIIKRWFRPFGLSNTLEKQLKSAAGLAIQTDDINNRLRKNSLKQWARYLEKNVPYVGPAKAGFFSALMGRGDLPTADSKELDFWLCRLGEWDKEKMRCRSNVKKVTIPASDKIMREIRQQLAKRLATMNVKMPVRYKPFYQHLVHHAVWDKIGQTATTHQSLIDAMKKA